MKDFIGNIEILKKNKTAFLCSQKIPSGAVLKCFDWAVEQREAAHCIISGFHSQIEKDVLHYLLKGIQPIIIVLARGLKQKIEPELIEPLNNGRLLIISPFPKTTKRVTTQTALERNKMIIALADKITVGFMAKGGSLENLISTNSFENIEFLLVAPNS